MAIIVQKYGGTSVETPMRILAVANKIIKRYDEGNDMVVVVSAMGDTTDKLIKLASKITNNPSKREMDMLLSTGEQISIALLTMALHKLGREAISLTGSQVGIRTDKSYTKAKIISINTKIIKKHLSRKRIVIVAGFQGIDEEQNITTLGRGGSDTTAVALAAVLKANVCEIYTDVEGVYTADPRIVPDAQKIDIISYGEMLELASLGAQVVHNRAVEFAEKYRVKLKVLSSFVEREGTCITKETKDMEDIVVRGVTYKADEVKITITNVPDRPGIAAQVFGMLADKNINVNMIVQNIGQSGRSDISFTVAEDDLREVSEIMNKVLAKVGGKEITIDKDIGIISIVGVGMSSHPGVAAQMFKTLADNKINIEMISTSEIKISCVIKRDKLRKSVRALHKSFGLSKGFFRR